MASYLEQPHLHTKAPFRAALLTYPGNLQEAFRQAQEDSRKTLFGIAHGIPSVFLTKVLASTKPDFIWIDVEHGMFDRLTLYDAIQAAQHHSEGKTLVIVRVPKHDEISMTTALDAGASGLVIPHTETAEEVLAFKKEMYYPPIGHRSFSPWTFTPGVSDQSLYDKDAFNIGTSNRHVAIIPQIESVKGVANADAIAATGVDALLFGPGDFMADAGIEMKLGGDPHPVLADAMMKFAAAGAKHNVPLMAGAMAPEQIPSMIEQGFRGIVTFFDVWGTAQTVAGLLEQGRGYAADSVKGVSQTNVKANGVAHRVTDGVQNGETNGELEIN